MIGYFLGALVLVILSGCGPVISSNLLRQAGSPADFAALQAHPEQYQGRVVILGGEVMGVRIKNGGSLLMVSQKPLDPQLRPVEAQVSGGSFLVESDLWLAPDAYVPQRKVTVAGIFEGRPQGTPLLRAREIYLWEHPFKLIAIPKEWYDPSLEYWYTPPYYDPWRHRGGR
jgi:outer membrane lipoprotein